MIVIVKPQSTQKEFSLQNKYLLLNESVFYVFLSVPSMKSSYWRWKPCQRMIILNLVSRDPKDKLESERD